MKTFLHTLIAVAAFFIQTSSVQGQYTYQTARRADSYVTIPTDSNVVLQPGIGTGSAIVTTQPIWMIFGLCTSGDLGASFNASASGISVSGNALSTVIYGPFSDTLNLGSKLINSNIDTCVNFNNLTGGIGWVYTKPNYQRGDIYVALFMSTAKINSVSCGGVGVPTSYEIDTAYCPFCNGRLSELYQSICTITYDSASQKNKLIWTKDIFSAAQDYVIFRKNTAGTYDTLPFQSISLLSEYIDVTSSPMSKLYEYKMGIRDSCGQLLVKNYVGPYFMPPFSTIHLITYPAGNNTASLLWNKGTFFGPYYIYRTDPSGITTLIDSVGQTTDPQTYTDINAPAGLCSYQVGVNLNPPCVASVMPSYTIVKSNPGYVTVTGINELTDLTKAISIEPNPFNQFTKVDLHLFTKQNLKVVLRNLTGQTVMQFENVKTDELIIERNNLSQGLYFLEVTGKDFYGRKKVVVD